MTVTPEMIAAAQAYDAAHRDDPDQPRRMSWTQPPGDQVTRLLTGAAPLIATAVTRRILSAADLQLVLGFARGTGGKPKAVREALDGIARLERELGLKP